MILLLFLLLWIRHVDRLLFSNPCCLRTSHRIYAKHQSVRFLVKKIRPGHFCSLFRSCCLEKWTR